MDKISAPQLEFAETAERFNHRMSMDNKGPIHPASKGNSYIFVICDAFTHFVVTKPTPLHDAQTAADILLKQWILFFGPPKILVTDNGTENFNIVIAKICIFWH